MSEEDSTMDFNELGDNNQAETTTMPAPLAPVVHLSSKESKVQKNQKSNQKNP